VGDRGLDLVGVDATVAVDRELHDLEAVLLEMAERVADRVMFDRRGHEPVAVRLARPGRALQAEVQRLGPAGCEDELPRLRADLPGDPLMGLVEARPRPTPEGVARPRPAEPAGSGPPPP